MRREGYIIEEIIEYSNMSEAFDSVLRGTGRKRSRQGRFLLAHREKIIAELTASIADGSFRLGGYHEREIEEYGKKRILQILSMKDRIAVFAIMNVVDRHLQKRYIRTTFFPKIREGYSTTFFTLPVPWQARHRATFGDFSTSCIIVLLFMILSFPEG